MEQNSLNLALNNKGFLQSNQWRKFQEAVGRKTFLISLPHPADATLSLKERGLGGEVFYASIIEHKLLIVGKYFYVPKGPVFCHPERSVAESKDLIRVDSSTTLGMTKLIDLAKENNIGWIRIEPESKNASDTIKNSLGNRVSKLVKAPHDMQPREILVMDITKTEEELLAEMKSKTRYNIKLSQKHNVIVKVISNSEFLISNPRIAEQGSLRGRQNPNYQLPITNYIDKFIELTRITVKRDNITPHPEEYYQKMFETIPAENLKLYVAEYQGKIIAANIMIFFEDTAIYLHGASDNEYRNVMAPYLLQWQAIKDAKKAGYKKYDFGGVKTPQPATRNPQLNPNKKVSGFRFQVLENNWSGITKFKLGFVPNTQPVEFPGSYDIILNPNKYYLYKILQKLKSII